MSLIPAINTAASTASAISSSTASQVDSVPNTLPSKEAQRKAWITQFGAARVVEQDFRAFYARSTATHAIYSSTAWVAGWVRPQPTPFDHQLKLIRTAHIELGSNINRFNYL